MFIQTDSTPNPNAMKFMLETTVSENPMHFSNVSESKDVILVQKLFSIQDVNSVFYGSDFITITKLEDSKWENLKALIISIIMDHISSGLKPLDGLIQSMNLENNNLTEIEKQIIEIIETRVRPSVAMDGGDITYCGFKEGVVYLELKGSCAGCPSSTITLKNGIESMLQYYVPEVISVEAI